ncbi:MAG: hypothetical protein HUU17_13870 [Chthonomonadales bacterium]|nr:hypothetical protein [Chthonomonadales bacterium]
MLEELGPKGLSVVGVTNYYGTFGTEKNLTPEQEYTRYADHIKEYKITWPVLFGPRTNNDNYGVSGIPHYVLIDRKGIVRKMSIGFSEPLHQQFRVEVEKLLAEK